MEQPNRKRQRSRSPPPWHKNPKSPRHDSRNSSSRRNDGAPPRRGQDSFAQERSRRNQQNEDAQMKEWLSKEDDFVLKQSKKKAQIRIREGRAQPIDWLAVVLSIIDTTRNILEEDSNEAEVDIMDPQGVIEGLGVRELGEVTKGIDTYLALETSKANRLYWKSMKIICKHKIGRLQPSAPSGRGVSAVSADVDKLLAPKSLEQLSTLETQVNQKLQSNEPIDEDYWEQMLLSIGVYKAKAQLKSIYSSVVESRLSSLKAGQMDDADKANSDFASLVSTMKSSSEPSANADVLDPEPSLKVKAEEKGLQIIEESTFLAKIDEERARIRKMGYIPKQSDKLDSQTQIHSVKTNQGASGQPGETRFSKPPVEDYSQATKALYDREVARGVQEDEEIFTGEEEVSTASKSQWSGKYRPRKPRYFNRVQMGYEWNKYNQTHYDHDNPPPKVVQGYKFNIFYPDLIDKTKAPTYRIERENGRKRGQTFAPAGEEDTCLIRFTSGPPYEDLAFRIVDREWDYSAKYERGFKSSFDKGILQLHFQFKKVYYRK